MSERRRTDPIPLGGGDEPYSKGLMARALMRVGVSAVRGAWEASARLRYLGPYPLVPSDTKRAEAEMMLNARLA